MKINLMVCIAFSCLTILSVGGVAYAEDSTSSVSSDIDIGVVDTDSVTTNDTTISQEGTTEAGTEFTTTRTDTTTETEPIVNVVVSNDDMFSGLDVLIDAYTTEYYAPEMTDETKAILTKLLTSLIISVATGDGSYTLETFKDAFIEILVEYGINVTDDVDDAITKYAVQYLEDDLEDDETDDYLVWIGGSVGLMTTLFITSQQGGVHRA